MIRDYTYLSKAYPLQRVVEKLEKKDGRSLPRKGMVVLIRWSPATLDPVGDTTSCVVGASRLWGKLFLEHQKSKQLQLMAQTAHCCCLEVQHKLSCDRSMCAYDSITRPRSL